MIVRDCPVLVAYTGALAGRRWPLSAPQSQRRRADDCDVVFAEDRQVSRYHARIEKDGDNYIIRDLGSKNGTSVNGEPVRDQPYRLRDGDAIELATVVQLGFVAADSTVPLESMPSWSVVDRLTVDAASRRVLQGRRELDPPLSPSQFELLNLLISQAGEVVTRQDVIEAVWPDAVGGVTDQAVDALVYRLRERLAELDPDRSYIVTVRGHGFRYD